MVTTDWPKFKKIKLPFCFIIIILVFCVKSFIYPQPIFAFSEDFNSEPINNTLWEVNENGASVSVENGAIHLSSGFASRFPFINSKTNPFSTYDNFTVKIRIKYNQITTKGSGLSLATEIPPNGQADPLLSNPAFSRRYLLSVWQSSVMGFYFQYAGDCYNQSCDSELLHRWEKGTSDLNYNTIELRYINGNYSILLNDESVFVSNKVSVRPQLLWFGNPSIQGTGDEWTNFEIDYILVEPISPAPQPLIFLPGMGASWNYKNMILGIEKPPVEWKMLPGLKIYDGLIQTLKNAGYTTEGENRNLFIFNYDWTKPVDSIADDLKNYINNVVDPPPGVQIDLVGHSLGGLTARTYVQNNPSDHQVDQVITVGSPHKGAVKVYYLWEGAELSPTLLPWEAMAAGLFIHIRKFRNENNVHAIQRLVPSLKDVLPTFNYLRKGSLAKPLSEMQERNHWLENLNQPPLPQYLLSSLSAISGLWGDTHRWLYIGHRTNLDERLGKWVDGKPVGQVWQMGDHTVLAESAQLAGAHLVELPGLAHRELVKTIQGQQAITDLLGITPSEFVPVPSAAYTPLLVFQLASPASLSVYDPDGQKAGEEYPEDKLVIVREPKEGEYQVRVNQEGEGGEFRLLIGKILPENNIWQMFEGQTTAEPKIFPAHFSPDTKKNKLELLRLAQERLESAKKKIQKTRTRLKKPFKFTINSSLKRIKRALSFFNRGKETRAQRQIETTIFSLDVLVKNLLRRQNLSQFPKGTLEGVIQDLAIAKDYLIQAHDL